jgi:hypothetical protein
MQPAGGTEALLARVDELLSRVEALLPRPQPTVTWDAACAWRWRRERGGGRLQPVAHPHQIRLEDLQGIERQKEALERNTRQFVAGLPANHALLWGARGTGKSSLVKALLNAYATRDLRLIEVDRQELVDLPEIIALAHGRPERLLLFCDDLGFAADDPSHRALKAVLDGSVVAVPDNVLLYATSNRRHLMPELMDENLQARNVEGEIHFADAIEEKVSLSERFGLWLSFYPFDQDTYLAIVGGWLARLGASAPDPQELRREALRWALTRGSRSGRAAYQFARDWVGRHGLSRPGFPGL